MRTGVGVGVVVCMTVGVGVGVGVGTGEGGRAWVVIGLDVAVGFGVDIGVATGIWVGVTVGSVVGTGVNLAVGVAVGSGLAHPATRAISMGPRPSSRNLLTAYHSYWEREWRGSIMSYPHTTCQSTAREVVERPDRDTIRGCRAYDHPIYSC